MILYSAPLAPNPRRVSIFAAEKGIQLPESIVNMRKGEHRSPEFLARNPSGKLPVLELDDGTCIAETVAISRYLESLQPEPNLFGRTPLETAIIEMHHRFIEFELFTQVGTSWVNGPLIAATGLIEPIEAAKARSDALVHAYYRRLDRELAARPFIAGERYTVADITAFCIVDFATTLVGLPPDKQLAHLAAWFENVGARESVGA